MSSIVKSVAQQLGSLLVEEAKHLKSVSGNIESLKTDLQWMQSFLEDTDKRQHQQKVMGLLVADMREFAYEAQDLIERYVHELSHPPPSGIWNTIISYSCVWGYVVTLHDIGSKIDDLRSRISDLISRLQLYGAQIKQSECSDYDLAAMREQRRTYSHIEEDPVGLEKHVKEVVDQLVLAKHSGVKVVSIPGIGGLGKTTLARRIYSEKAVKEHFKNNCVWVYISKHFERRDVFEEILIGLSSSTNSSEYTRKGIKRLTNDELPRKICQLLEEKECLVVLDDVWDNNAWNILKPAFQSGTSSGSKILITTRDHRLAEHGDLPRYFHPFGFLSDDDGWTLLQLKAFSEGNRTALEDTKVKDRMVVLGTEMLKHCGGLPLAIVALGGILATKKTVNEWETIHKNITSCLVSTGQENGSDNVASVLELSYYDLPFYLKPCFLYLGSFPKDFEIQAERLYHLWQAEGLVTNSAEDNAEMQGVSLDYIAESYLHELVKRNMVLVEKQCTNGRIKTCRLHDIMRDLCLKKCKDINFLKTVEHGGSDEVSFYGKSSPLVCEKLRRCAIYLKKDVVHDSAFDPRLAEGPCVRSLLVFPYGSSEAEMLLSRGMRKLFSLLRVLDVEGTSIQELPVVAGDFIHLRYLSIRHTLVFNLSPCIWDCKYLETLDLRSYNTFQLSNNNMCKLERLRHLYLPRDMEIKGGSGKLILSPNQLRQMETLKNFDARQCQMEDLGKMTNLRVFSFSETQIIGRDYLKLLLASPIIEEQHLVNPLRLSILADAMNKEPKILSSLAGISVSLGIRGEIKIPFGVDENPSKPIVILPRNLTSLHLQWCEINSEDISFLGKLPHLKELVLKWTATEAKMSFPDGSFQQLVKLFLEHLRYAEEWEVGEGALPNLRYLSIDWCLFLKMIPECLPTSVYIKCLNPCINGIQHYNTCPYFNPTANEEEEEESSS